MLKHCIIDYNRLIEYSTNFQKALLKLQLNYRPISILRIVSKVFEKVLETQLAISFLRLSDLLCCFTKGRNTEHALLNKSSFDNSNIVGTVFMDLSKVYDCLPHNLLIAKLAAYGIDHDSLTL